jgi:hypothetical protein
MTKDAFVKLLLTKEEKPARDKKYYNSDLPLMFTRKYLEGVYDNVVTSEFRLFYTECDLVGLYALNNDLCLSSFNTLYF